jgi:hypothetical protein
MNLEEITAEVSRLPEAERLELISRITGELGSGLTPAVEKSWEIELKRRIALLDSGAGETRDVDAVISELLAETDAAD